MSIIQPSGKIWLCKNVPLNPSMEDTLYFGSENDRYYYFLNHSDISFTNVSYIRIKDGVIRLQVNPDRVYNYNYMMFTNTNFSDRYFFAFITSVRYVNNVTAEISFKLDPMITWFFDYHLKDCYVEREHSSTDNIGDNIIPEDINYNNYIICQENSVKFNDPSLQSHVLVLTSGLISEGIPTEPMPAVYAGTYCGLSAFIFDVSRQKGEIDTLILKYFGANSEMVVAIITVPYWLIMNAKASTDWRAVGTQSLGISRNMGGRYTPRNNKLFTYPFNKCVITDMHGNEIDLAFEFFDNNRAVIDLWGVLIPSPEILAAPRGYQGNINDYNIALSWSDFPKVAWASNYFREWYNQNVSKINASVQANTIANLTNFGLVTLKSTLAGGPAGGLVGAAVSGAVALKNMYSNVKNTLADISSAQRVSNPVHGALGSSNMLTAESNLWQMGLFQKCYPPQILSSIDSYFDMFGYATKRVKHPNTWVREHWTYTKTIGCEIGGDIPAEDMQEICNIYDNGIRFWWGNADGTDVVGQYNLSNNPI